METTWDTDEVIRWIDNDEPLYHLAYHLALTQIDLADALRSDVDWEQYNDNITAADVDWDHVAAYIMDHVAAYTLEDM
jgi:hypothetical protein